MGGFENPPAFPQQCADALDVGMVHAGMTLRDWFAGQALAGLLASPFDGPAGSAEQQTQHFARMSYSYADAMLAARTNEPKESPTAARPVQSEAEIARLKELQIANSVNGTCTTCDRTAAECDCLPF